MEEEPRDLPHRRMLTRAQMRKGSRWVPLVLDGLLLMIDVRACKGKGVMKALLDAVLMQMALIFVVLSSVVVDEGGGKHGVAGWTGWGIFVEVFIFWMGF